MRKAFDQEIYEQIAETVLLATKRYAHVCFLVPGHPLIYVTSSSLILDRAQRMGITTTVLPGISSLDTMIIQLRLEIGGMVCRCLKRIVSSTCRSSRTHEYHFSFSSRQQSVPVLSPKSAKIGREGSRC